MEKINNSIYNYNQKIDDIIRFSIIQGVNKYAARYS